MKQDKKLSSALQEAARYLRKSADMLDKLAEGGVTEGEGQNHPKKRRICD